MDSGRASRWLVAYFFLLLVYSWFSYAFVDPNLVIINNPNFWQFQVWMWDTLLNNRLVLMGFYATLILLMFYCYSQLINVFRATKSQGGKWGVLPLAMIVSLPLYFSYNALSHDVFNYMFNARMLLDYGVSPHQTAAIIFDSDPWLRFMHNTHTTAPYGIIWTWISVLPYVLGWGKFILTWLTFRLFSVLSLVLIYFALDKLSLVLNDRKLLPAEAAVFLLNPLVLIEVISNQHNDLWMMLGAVAGLCLMLGYVRGSGGIFRDIAGLSFWIGSILVKFASFALLPVFILAVLKKNFEKKSSLIRKLQWSIFPDIAAVLMFLPLLTSRSQQFHPWYLLWVLVWLPVMKHRILKALILAFSLSSMLRYLPWMLTGGYSEMILLQQKLITWALPAVILLIYLAREKIVTKSQP